MPTGTEQDVFFEALYKEHFGRLKAIAYAKFRNLPVAEELAQETFLVVLKKYETVRHYENLESYLNTVLHFKILEYTRSRNQYVKLFVSLDQDFKAEAAAAGGSPSSVPGILETVRNTLDKDDWYLLKRFVVDSASHRQIAEELGISVSASQKRLERIRKKLEDALPGYWK